MRVIAVDSKQCIVFFSMGSQGVLRCSLGLHPVTYPYTPSNEDYVLMVEAGVYVHRYAKWSRDARINPAPLAGQRKQVLHMKYMFIQATHITYLLDKRHDMQGLATHDITNND